MHIFLLSLLRVCFLSPWKQLGFILIFKSMVSVLRFLFSHEHSRGFQAGGNSDPRHPTVCEHEAMKTTFAVTSWKMEFYGVLFLLLLLLSNLHFWVPAMVRAGLNPLQRTILGVT